MVKKTFTCRARIFLQLSDGHVHDEMLLMMMMMLVIMLIDQEKKKLAENQQVAVKRSAQRPFFSSAITQFLQYFSFSAPVPQIYL